MVHTGSASTQEAVLIPSAAASPTFPTCALLNGFKVKDKKVIVVVGRLILQHRHRQLQAHPCVSSFPWERFPHALGFLVIPDGCKVPGHQPIAVIPVDEMCCTPATSLVTVDFSAGTTWARVTHLSEVILYVTREGFAVIQPQVLSDLLALQFWF